MLKNLADVLATSTTSTGKPAFEHGENYPAIIAGVWAARGSWEKDVFDGFVLLFFVKDDEGRVVARSGKFIKFYAGYNPLNARTAYAQLMCGLLGKALDGAALGKAIAEAGLDDITKLVGRPCTVRMAVKSGGYAVIDAVSAATARRPGLTEGELGDPTPISIKNVFGKFVEIPDAGDCEKLPCVKVKDAITTEDIPF